jgi:hypothetical protein
MSNTTATATVNFYFGGSLINLIAAAGDLVTVTPAGYSANLVVITNPKKNPGLATVITLADAKKFLA